MARKNLRRTSLGLESLENRWCPAGNQALRQEPEAAFAASATISFIQGDIPEPTVNQGTVQAGNNFAPNGPNAGWIQFSGGVVGIYATSLSDTATVSYNGAFSPATPTILVTLNNAYGTTARILPTFSVSRIEFYGYNGNDNFTNNTYIPSIAEGGSGNDTLTGGFGADDLRGRTGADTLNGRSGNDKLYGGDQIDSIDGGSGDDTIAGNDGNDTLHGANGEDLMSGGYGNDSVYGDADDDEMYGDSGNDLLYGGTGNDYIHGSYGDDQLFGDVGNDTLIGGDGDDYILAGDGDDDLVGDNIGEYGDDTLHGGNGNDWVYGGDGNDVITGGAGDDDLFGADGNDTISGSSNDDYLSGGSGNDELDGGSGNDTLSGGNNTDVLLGGSGNDDLDGGSGNDSLVGDSGNDTLHGGDGHDTLLGGDGNDDLYGGAGNDTLYGNAGNDDLFGDSGLDGLFAGIGFDTVSGGSGADRILTQDINGDTTGVWDFDSDELTDVADEDAVIRFYNDNRVWSEDEILLVDGGLSRLHNLIGSTTLLKDPQNTDSQMRFYRRDEDASSPGNNGTNNGTSVFLYDVTFTSGANWVAFVTVHEIGHFWDEPSENSFVDEFRAESGWTTQYGSADAGDVQFVGDPFGSGGSYFVKAKGGDWWYEGGSEFVTDYAMTNPNDDFADTFTAVVLGEDFARNGNDTPTAPTGKLSIIQDWIDSLN